jgi:hypothetical protein
MYQRTYFLIPETLEHIYANLHGMTLDEARLEMKAVCVLYDPTMMKEHLKQLVEATSK